MRFQRGQFVWWLSNSGPGVARVATVDYTKRRIKVEPDNRAFPMWIPMDICGLHTFPELELNTPQRSDYA